jgi:hypothetical protein
MCGVTERQDEGAGTEQTASLSTRDLEGTNSNVMGNACGWRDIGACGYLQQAGARGCRGRTFYVYSIELLLNNEGTIGRARTPVVLAQELPKKCFRHRSVSSATLLQRLSRLKTHGIDNFAITSVGKATLSCDMAFGNKHPSLATFHRTCCPPNLETRGPRIP